MVGHMGSASNPIASIVPQQMRFLQGAADSQYVAEVRDEYTCVCRVHCLQNVIAPAQLNRVEDMFDDLEAMYTRQGWPSWSVTKTKTKSAREGFPKIGNILLLQ
jgi:hypothetical protein